MRRRSLATLAAALAFLAAAPTAHARQAPDDTRDKPQVAAEEPGLLARARAIADRLEGTLDVLHRRGIYPDAGSIVSGSGLAVGVGLRHHALAGSRVGGEVEGAWSVRGYRLYSGRFGLLRRSRDTLELDRAETNVHSLFNVHDERSPGLAAYLDVTGRRFPQVDFFGLDATESGRKTDFALSGPSVDLVVQWQPASRFALAARAGLVDLDLGPGTNEAVPNLEEHFDAGTAPGLSSASTFVTLGLAGAVDTRDAPRLPTGGTFLGAAIWHVSPQRGRAEPFTRLAIDARIFRSIGSRRHVGAVRVMGAVDGGPSEQPTPFYLQYWLGGSHSLRGFSSYRFRGEALVHVSAEYRWRVAELLDLVPFVDAGTAAARVSDLTRPPLHVTPGVGILARDDERLFFRLDWAHGAEGHRMLFSLSPSF